MMKFIMVLFHQFFLTCDEATMAILKKEDGSLSLKGRIQLWGHNVVCELCRRFEVQNQFIDQILHAHTHLQVDPKTKTLWKNSLNNLEKE